MWFGFPDVARGTHCRAEVCHGSEAETPGEHVRWESLGDQGSRQKESLAVRAYCQEINFLSFFELLSSIFEGHQWPFHHPESGEHLRVRQSPSVSAELGRVRRVLLALLSSAVLGQRLSSLALVLGVVWFMCTFHLRRRE